MPWEEELQPPKPAQMHTDSPPTHGTKAFSHCFLEQAHQAGWHVALGMVTLFIWAFGLGDPFNPNHSDSKSHPLKISKG